MKEYREQLENLQERIAQAMALVGLEQKSDELKDLSRRMQQPDFWDAPQEAQKISQRYADLEKEIETWEQLYADAHALHALAAEAPEGDSEARAEIAEQISQLEKKFAALEFTMLLSEPYDESSAIMAIHAGAGGTEAQDWAGMLMRMYARFCEARGWTVRVVDESRGQEAGWKSVTMHIHGRYAYGYLKGEHGVHRLVRISPFDAEKMRHTSFALVEVLPELEETKDIPIDPKDLRIDTFMSGGHGGQSVNTTYSAVRIVHIPTGIAVSCQNERSQQQNKETAMKILRARLYKLAQEAQQKEKQELRGAYQSAEWGNQARSYVLHPYQLVKDHRTAYETADSSSVLDGELQPFIEAYLKWRKTSTV